MNKKLLLALKFNETDHSNEYNKKVIKKTICSICF